MNEDKKHLLVARDVILENLKNKRKGTCLLITGFPKKDCEDLKETIKKGYPSSKNIQ